MKKSTFLLITFASVAVLSCKKDLSLYEESRQYCRDNIQFSCSGTEGDRFFSGKINGTAFCVSEGVAEYWRQNVVIAEVFTSTQDPVLKPGTPPSSSWFSFGLFPPIMDNLNGLMKELTPGVSIYTPAINDTNVYKPSEYFERFIKKGDLPLKDYWGTDKYSGFDFSIGWRCVLLPGYEHYQQQNPERIPSVSSGFAASFGPQQDAVFKISEYEKIKTSEHVIYNITFEIECDLYYTTYEDDYAYYGRLTEGVFKTQVVLLLDE